MAVAVQLGERANGTFAVSSYMPSLLSQCVQFVEALEDSPDLNDDIPIPKGMKLVRASDKKQCQLILGQNFAQRFRKIYGYIGEIKITESDFTETGAQLQIVVFLPWRYGAEPEETCNSWIYARLNCYTSTAAFSEPYRMIKLGSAVCGFLEASTSEYGSAQLTGWDLVSTEEWLRVSENTFPPAFDLYKDAIFKLPQLACANLATFYPPNAPYLFVRSPSVPKYFQNQASREAYNNRHRAFEGIPPPPPREERPRPPSASPGRRRRQRSYRRYSSSSSSSRSSSLPSLRRHRHRERRRENRNR